jgi:hypothetical protein
VNELKQLISGMRAPGQRQGASACANSFIVFCGDTQEVCDGFALALSAIEDNRELLLMSTEQIPNAY